MNRTCEKKMPFPLLNTTWKYEKLIVLKIWFSFANIFGYRRKLCLIKNTLQYFWRGGKKKKTIIFFRHISCIKCITCRQKRNVYIK